MQQGLATKGRLLARKGIYIQLIVSLILVIGVTLLRSQLSIDILLGCISFVVPHIIFSYWVFRYAGASNNQRVAQSLSQGMKIKLILTCILFVVAFSQFDVHPLPLLGAYATVMVSQWLAMLVLKSD
jgi:ATP synthase protein I